MTIEEKAKAYDEVREKIALRFGFNVAEEIFSEFEMSEDERIREEIIYFLSRNTFQFGEDIDKYKSWVAWLEKQGEQKVSAIEFNAKDWYVSEVDGKIHNATFMEKPHTNQTRKLEIEKAAMSATGIIEQEEWFIKGAEWADENPSYISSEKQGEQKTQAKSAIEIWKDMRLEVYQQASGNRHEANYSDDTTKMFSLNDIDEIIEKISEQKLADKTEPKFHEGDWIMDKESKEVFYISKNLANTYKIVDIEGNDYHVPHYILEEDYDVWTIQDAKDGDVLYSPVHNILWIYKDKDRYHAAINLNYAIFVSFNADIVIIPSDVQPATKEQSARLFQKMKEAGYEWDEEKKELKHYEKD